MMYLWARFNTATTIRFPMVKRGVVDLAQSADWTPATGDCKFWDGTTLANTNSLPAIVGGAGSTVWALPLLGTELDTAEVNIQIVDAATKAVEDQFLTIYTYGNASAKIQADLGDAVRLGLTALPNANAEAAGGLYTRGTGAGQINQPANGQIDSRVVAFLADTGLQNIRSGTAQAGSTTSTIVLDAGASAVDDFYNNCYVYIVGGLAGAVGQARRIRDYTGSSKTAAVARNWITTPDNTSVFVILPEASVWDEFAADHVTAATFGAIEGQSLTTSELLDQLVGPVATVVDTGGNTASSFQISTPSVAENAANWWNRAWLSFDGTAGLAYQTKRITAYNQTTGFVTVEDGFTAIPAAGSTARIVTR